MPDRRSARPSRLLSLLPLPPLTNMPSPPDKLGTLQAALTFVIWGLFPLYFALLATVPPLEVVLHRAVWSLATLVVVLTVLRRWAWLAPLMRQPRQIAVYATSAAMIAANWLVYIYAVQSGQVLQSSLGYFINPLVNVSLGVLVLQERLSRAQWLAVALAACGVSWLTWTAGGLPWIALTLAVAFGVYGLVRKTAALGALEGLTAETLLLMPLALPCLIWLSSTHSVTAPVYDGTVLTLLLLSGPLTALPLWLFASAARRLPLASMGLMQYISPTLQFGLGVWVFHEPFDTARLLGFVFIWAGLVVFSWDALRRR